MGWILAGFLVLVVGVHVELLMRAKKSLAPAGWRALLRLSSRANNPHRAHTAFAFAFMAAFSMSLWEGCLWGMLSGKRYDGLFLLVPLLGLFALFFRRLRALKDGRDLSLHRYEVLHFALCWMALMQSMIGLLLWPWALWRAWSFKGEGAR